jgi:hypothetical protein
MECVLVCVLLCGKQWNLMGHIKNVHCTQNWSAQIVCDDVQKKCAKFGADVQGDTGNLRFDTGIFDRLNIVVTLDNVHQKGLRIIVKITSCVHVHARV